MNCTTNSCGCTTTNSTTNSATNRASTAATQPARSHQPEPTSSPQPRAYRPPANVVELPDRYQIALEVPGSSRDAIDIQVHEGTLSVTARVAPRTPGNARHLLHEFGIGDYRRQFRVGEDIDPAAITATYEHGVLAIDLPKAARATPRRVPIAAN
ncbi:MAG: Hsp20/alpha crystallin family protein [Phycisphaerales bacterium]